MTPLDYLLLVELLILIVAAIFAGIGEMLGRDNPKDELRRTMRCFWRELVRPSTREAPVVVEIAADKTIGEMYVKNRSDRDKSREAAGVNVTCVLNVKVVPGASRDQIAGRLGNDIKVQVSAPPEGGEANKAVIDVLAEALEIRSYQIKLIRGHYQPRKAIQISGMTLDQVEEKLEKFL